MAGQNTPPRPRRVSPPRNKGRAILRHALEFALKRADATHNAAARWLGLRPSTLRRWLAGTHRIDVEAVIESKKLGQHFCTCVALAEKRFMRSAGGDS